MNFFDEASLRLKQQLGMTQDKDVALALALSPRAWAGRKQNGAFPEKELYALAAKRPDLRLDVDYVLTGITSAARGLLDAAQARMERANDAGVDFPQWQSFGYTPARMAQLGDMLSTLRAVEFAAVFNLVETIVSLREALGTAVGQAPAADQPKRRKKAA